MEHSYSILFLTSGFITLMLIDRGLSAAVSERCLALSVIASDDTQCLYASLSHSAYEGVDRDVVINATSEKDRFSLILYSNTPSTKLIEGYEINLKTTCTGIDSLMLYSGVPYTARVLDACSYDLVGCDSDGYKLQVKKPSPSSSIFHLIVSIPKPSKETMNVQVFPMLEDGQAVYSQISSDDLIGFSPTDISHVNQTTTCVGQDNSKQASVSDSKEPLPAGAVIAVVVACLVLLAAVMWKVVDILLTRKSRNRRAMTSYEAGVDMEEKPSTT